MSLLDVLRSGVKLADKITKPLQSDVSYVRVTAHDEYGAPSGASAVTLKAIVDFKSVPVRNKEGITVTTSAVITLLDIAEIVAATAGEGVAVDDEFTLANGMSGKVLNIGGFMDAGTGHPIPTTVYLG
jgi:hypothetical protein